LPTHINVDLIVSLADLLRSRSPFGVGATFFRLPPSIFCHLLPCRHCITRVLTHTRKLHRLLFFVRLKTACCDCSHETPLLNPGLILGTQNQFPEFQELPPKRRRFPYLFASQIKRLYPDNSVDPTGEKPFFVPGYGVASGKWIKPSRGAGRPRNRYNCPNEVRALDITEALVPLHQFLLDQPPLFLVQIRLV
jgi:hypothetical protein